MSASVRSNFQKALLTLSMVVVLLTGTFGWLAVTAPDTEAASVSCGSGRCTLWLSKAETAALGRGNVPAPPAAAPWQIKAAYYALAYGHRWFAQQYASWGWCSGFRLSIYPWETQGYFGYRC
jgi:hypothetical protein